MALSRPFAYNNTGSPISGTTQYGDLIVGDIEAPYGANYGGVTWWGGPDEDLRYAIGNFRPGGQPVPSGVTETANVGFWGTELGDKTNEGFLNLANYIGALNNQPPFANATEASNWLTNNGYWNSYRTWSAGGPLITARQSLAGAGTQNAGLAFGGATGNSPADSVSCTEEYNGSSWSTGGALINARCALAGAGSQHAGLATGGSPGATQCTEEYNGSSWSTGGDMIYGKANLGSAGTQNAGLSFGGQGITSCPFTEEYNGTSWSLGGNLITARHGLAGAGTQNAGLAFGGRNSPAGSLSCTEEYNGSSWSAGGALITARQNLGGAGTQNAGLAFGGGAPSTGLSCTEEYNGSSWTTVGFLITARASLAGAGTQAAGLAFGGAFGGPLSCTEEYS